MSNFNNNFGYNPGMYPNGTYYTPMVKPKMTQPLSEEQIKAIAINGGEFSLKVDPADILRSICTHKHNGQYTLRPNADGSLTCDICKATFNLMDLEPEMIAQAKNTIINYLQSIKTYYLDIPDSYVTDYFKMIPLLDKLPEFGKVAMDNFKRYENGNPIAPNNNMPGGFALYNQMMTPSFGAAPIYNPGAYSPQGAPFGQPMMGQPMPQQFAPQGNAFVAGGYQPQPFAQSPVPGYNPAAAYGQPMMGQPMPQQFAPQGFDPAAQQAFANQSAAPVAPSGPDQNGEAVVTKAFNV